MEYKGVTNVKVNEVLYQWEIININMLNYQFDQMFESTPFFMNELEWKLCFKIDNPPNSRGLIRFVVGLYLKSKNESTVIVTLNFDNPNKMNSLQINNQSIKANDNPVYFNYYYNYPISKVNLTDEKLIIKCKIISGTIDDFPKTHIGNMGSINQLSNDFQKLWDNKHMCDFKIISSGREFKVHKLVLSARSPIFFALFNHETKDSLKNVVYIEDIDADVVEEMLVYIYTDKITKLDTLAAELLKAAEKYDLKKLKEICEEYLCSKLSDDNVFDFCSLADMYNCEKLKTESITFICTNKDVNLFQEKILTKLPSLLPEILTFLLKLR